MCASAPATPPHILHCFTLAGLSDSEQQKIDGLARDVAQSLQSCDVGVKQVSPPAAQARNLSPQEARVRANAQTALGTRLHGLPKRLSLYIFQLEERTVWGALQGCRSGIGKSRTLT